MKQLFNSKVILALVVTILIAGASGYYWYFENLGSLPKTVQYTTPKGLSFRHIAIPKANKSAVSIVWRTDFAALKPGHEKGAAIGIQLMSNGGAGELSAAEIIADFEELDAGARIWANPREIRGFIVTPADGAVRAAQITNMVLRSPKMDERWLRRFKKQHLDSGKKQEGHSTNILWNTARKFMIGDHPYERYWRYGIVKGLENLTLDEVKAWWATSFSKNQLWVTSAGNLKPEKIGMLIDTALEGLPNLSDQDAASKIPPLPTLHFENKTILIHRPEIEKSRILVIGRFPNGMSREALALLLAEGVLGRGGQSRLFKAVRTQLRAAYRFGAKSWAFSPDQKILSIGGEVEGEKLAQALKVVETTYKAFRKDGITLVEFPVAKKFAADFIKGQFNKPENVAYMLMDDNIFDRGTNGTSNLLNDLSQLDRVEINDAIRKEFPAWDTMTKIILSPDPDILDADCIISGYQEVLQCRSE